MRKRKIILSFVLLCCLFFSAFLPFRHPENGEIRHTRTNSPVDHGTENQRAENFQNTIQASTINQQKKQSKNDEESLVNSPIISGFDKKNTLYDWLLLLIENTDFDLVYQDLKSFVEDIENVTSFWESFDFSLIQESFSLQNQNFIMALADETFPEKFLHSIISWGQSAGFSDFKETDLTTRFFLPIRSKEFIFSRDFSIRTIGNITNFYDGSRNKIGSITRHFDHQIPDQIRFTFQDYQQKRETDFIFINTDTEFLVLMNSIDILRIKLDSRKKIISIDENDVPAKISIIFSPENNKIKLQIEDQDIVQTAELQLDQQLRSIRFSLSDEELFSLQFLENSQIYADLQEDYYLIKFDDRNHQVRILPDDIDRQKYLLRFDRQQNKILLSSYQSLWKIEKLFSLQFNKSDKSILFQAQDNPQIKIRLDSRKQQIILDNGYFETVFGPDILEELITGYMFL